MKSTTPKPAVENASPFYFIPMPKGILVTNDWGGWAVLSKEDFSAFSEGRMGPEHSARAGLAASGFFLQPADFLSCSEKFGKLHATVFKGVLLHIMVLTARCNHKCVYCHASAHGAAEKGLDMDEATAKQTVDFIMGAPGRDLVIEFQGGEPLLNWGTLAYTVKYAEARAAELGKNVEFKLVTNLSAMDEAKLKFLFEHKVGMATSLDGPAAVHDRQRVLSGGSSHAAVVKWLKRFNALRPRYLKGGYIFRLVALATVTRAVLARPKALVDEYLSLGLREVYARPLNPFGSNAAARAATSYSAAEFLAFYRELLEYLLDLNARGVKVREKTAQTFLTKILGGEDPGHVDCRLLCGAGIGQLAYNYNGDVYTCDEGRMLAMMGDEAFKLGNVADLPYSGAAESPVTKTLCVASCLESLPGCSDCAMKPFCGVCPADSYYRGSLFPQKAADRRCAINKGVLKLIFEKLAEPRDRAILASWTNAAWYRDNLKGKKEVEHG